MQLNEKALREALKEAVEGECEGLAIDDDQAAAILTHVLSALPADAGEPMKGVRVKALVWRKYKGDEFCYEHYDADALGGSYTIEARSNGRVDLWIPNQSVGETFLTLESAKAAAQADYERRILSAFEQPDPAGITTSNPSPTGVATEGGAVPANSPAPVNAEMLEAFDARRFSAENLARCTSASGFNHPLASWSLSDWMTATLGELGEAANVLKKLNRVRDGVPGNKETPDDLRAMFADEIADSYIYLDLLAQAAGIDLPSAVRSKFDRTSAKIGYIASAEASPAPVSAGGDGGDEAAWIAHGRKYAASFAASEVEFFDKLEAREALIAKYAESVKRNAAELATMPMAPVLGTFREFADELAALSRPSGDGWRSMDTELCTDYVMRYGGRCRDCADEDGVCPHTGLTCDVETRRRTIERIIKALNYGFANGFLPTPPSSGEGR